MNLMQYKVMWDWIENWQRENNTKELPAYVKVDKLGIGLETIQKAEYLDMYQRVLKWKDTHNGAMPEFIGVEAPAIGTEPTPLPFFSVGILRLVFSKNRISKNRISNI
jgi:hypothetical protein